jgi:hypothetical protein
MKLQGIEPGDEIAVLGWQVEPLPKWWQGSTELRELALDPGGEYFLFLDARRGGLFFVPVGGRGWIGEVSEGRVPPVDPAKLTKAVRKAIEQIPADAWTPIPYWLEDGADVAETGYRPFGKKGPLTRLIVRRVRPTPGGQLALALGALRRQAAWLALCGMAYNLARWTGRLGVGSLA